MINSYYERTENGFKFDKDMEKGSFRLVNQEEEIKVYDSGDELASFKHNYSENRDAGRTGQEIVQNFLESDKVSEEFIEAAGGTDYLKIFISRILDSDKD
ncbi:MAG: hypothetical protein ACI977_000016 [Candidatus Nanohaloarchaea archaeon]|jgi:hypothetical protein